MKPTQHPKRAPALTLVPKTESKCPSSSARLAELLETLDDIHTAVSEHRLAAAATLSRAELVAWLHEVSYLVEETLEEMEEDRETDFHPAPAQAEIVRLVRQSS